MTVSRDNQQLQSLFIAQSLVLERTNNIIGYDPNSNPGLQDKPLNLILFGVEGKIILT